VPDSDNRHAQRLARLSKQLEAGQALLPDDAQWVVSFASQMRRDVSGCILRIRECLDESDTLNWPDRFADINEDLADAIGDGSE
jgi:hypothetical protein